MIRIPIVDMIIEQDDKLLMLKRNFEPQGKFDIPGGFVDNRESIEKAAIREAKEETGFDVELVQKFGIYDYFDKAEKTVHVFIGKIIGGKMKSSREGTPIWINFSEINSDILACPQKDIQILNDYLKTRGSETTLRSRVV
ncbi:MAG: NUDIX hydrolase [Nanoarchaeota archaeon]|nr:NUDIX hydrolase [Nanoarchaeota archaeon]